MKYPEICAYTETFLYSTGRFRTLSGIKPALNRRQEVDFTAGSGSVVFRAEWQGKNIAVKCFTKPGAYRQEHYRSIDRYMQGYFLQPVQFLDEEIYVFDETGNGAWYPAVVWEWIEGRSLGTRLRELCEVRDQAGLRELSEAFDRLARWLLVQEFAHGDLKPDNILVAPDGQLKLIDHDAFFTPDKAGSLSVELGTPGFQHPGRTRKHFDRTIDDYSIALIGTALHALVDCPEWYAGQVHSEQLLFDPAEAVARRSEPLDQVKAYWLDRGQTALYRLATLLHSPTPELPELAGILEQIAPAKQSVPDLDRESNWTIFRKNGCYGFRNESSGETIDAVYDDAMDFSEGLAAVRVGKRWRHIDIRGQLVIDASGFDKAGSFFEGRAAVAKGKKWGYIDREGNAIIPLLWESARRFSEGLAAVCLKGKWGYIDPQGELKIPCRFESAFNFREGAAVASADGRFGYIDSVGRWAIEPRYTFASGFRDGTATAEIDGQTVRLVKKEMEMKEFRPDNQNEKQLFL